MSEENKYGPKCPRCGEKETRRTHFGPEGDGRNLERICESCGKHFVESPHHYTGDSSSSSSGRTKSSERSESCEEPPETKHQYESIEEHQLDQVPDLSTEFYRFVLSGEEVFQREHPHENPGLPKRHISELTELVDRDEAIRQRQDVAFQSYVLGKKDAREGIRELIDDFIEKERERDWKGSENRIDAIQELRSKIITPIEDQDNEK